MFAERKCEQDAAADLDLDPTTISCKEPQKNLRRRVKKNSEHKWPVFRPMFFHYFFFRSIFVIDQFDC